MENGTLNCELIAVADSGNHCVKIFKYKWDPIDLNWKFFLNIL